MSKAKEMLGDNESATNMLLFSMWTDTMKAIAENGKGNIMFFDGSAEGMENIMRRMMALTSLKETESRNTANTTAGRQDKNS
jgi:prepilin-type processing-associated H-X9-DG protein